jgi:hypothetical protein
MTTKKDSLKGIEEEVLSSRKVANNTFEVIYKNGNRAIRLHYTDILTFTPDGEIILHTGGWNTVTTKERMRKFLPHPYSIHQIDYEWFLLTRDADYNVIEKQRYFDGMSVNININAELAV